MANNSLQKILFLILLILSFIITVVPEYRYMALLFYVLIYFYLLFTSKKRIPNNDVKRALNLLYIISAVNLIMIFSSPEYFEAGIIYMVLGSFFFLFSKREVFKGKENKKELVGIKPNLGQGVLIGALISIGFIFLNSIAPNFALGLPSVPLSLALFWGGVVVILFASYYEESFFRKILLEILQNKFGHSFARANIEQAGFFASFHILAYGIVLGTLKSLSQLFGEFQAISGMIITAFVFGLLMGWLIKKYRNLLTNYTSHSIINAYLYTIAFSVFVIAV